MSEKSDEETFRRLYFEINVSKRVSVERWLMNRFPYPAPIDWWTQMSQDERNHLMASVRG